MRFFKRLLPCILAGWTLMMSGCRVEVGGLMEVSRSIDGMRAQIDKTTRATTATSAPGEDVAHRLERIERRLDRIDAVIAGRGHELERVGPGTQGLGIREGQDGSVRTDHPAAGTSARRGPEGLALGAPPP